MKRNDYNIMLKQQLRFLEKSCRDYDSGDESEGIRIAGHLRTLLHDSNQQVNFDSNLITIINGLLAKSKEKNIFNSNSNKQFFQGRLKSIKHKIEEKRKPQITSKSLLTQMNLNHLKFLDTSIPIEKYGIVFYEIDTLHNTTIHKQDYYGLLAKKVTHPEGPDGIEVLTRKPLYNHFYFNTHVKECEEINFTSRREKIIYDDGTIKISRKNLILKVANLDGYAHIDENIDLRYETFKQANILETFINSNEKSVSNLPTLATIRQIAFEVIETFKKIFKKEKSKTK